MNTLRSSPPLICCAIPLGYGPAAKLAVLATALRERDIPLVFVGRGSALELAARHGELFSEIVAAETPSDVSESLLQSSAGMLSIMDREFATLAAQFGKPLFVVDSLLWMRDELPAAWHSAQRLWAQNFIGLHESGHLARPRLTIVGPIVAPVALQNAAANDRLLINLGGCESPDRDHSLSASYSRFVVENLLASPLVQSYRGRATLIAGQQCIAGLRERYRDFGLEFLSLSHEDALAQLARANCVFTAPGLTMTLECFQRGVPTFFLPPQNYSQWCILRALRSQSLAPASLHWEDVMPNDLLAERTPEATRNPVVRQAVTRLTADPTTAWEFRNRLARISRVDSNDLARRQHEFFDSLGANGAEAIADELAAELRLERTLPAVAATVS